MKKQLLQSLTYLAFFTSSFTAVAQEPALYKQVGFSNATGGYENANLTGGTVVSVSSFSQLKQQAENANKVVIKVTGAIDGGNSVINVKSNKTIIGEGDKADLKGVQLLLKGVSNVIIRNIKLHETPNNGDLIGLEDAKNIWVDHCEFYNIGIVGNKDEYDGLLDAKGSSQNITVSWNYFHDHWKGLLFGSSDSDNADRKACFHHNYFFNVNSRLPSYRGGTGHIFNNFYEKIPGSGVNSRVNACLRVENNVFQDVSDAITSLDSPTLGKWDVSNNVFLGTTTGQITTSNCTFKPPYDYSAVLLPVTEVQNIVKRYSGINKLNMSPVLGISEESVSESAVTVSPNPTEGIITITNFSGTYKISDSQGNLISEGEGNNVDLSNNPAGLYFIQTGNKVSKIVKK